jgi:DNA primase
VQELKGRVNIVDILSRNLHITKKGKNYWANCPFHAEKTPSFCVNESDQFYHCFGCGRSGDVITYLRESQNLEYNEAVEELCRIAGVKPPEKQLNEKNMAYQKDLQAIYNINKVSARRYRDNLFSEEGAVARNYLAHRGFRSETVAAFGLGYSKNYRDLPEYLAANGYGYDTMKLAGLIGENINGYYDALGGRLITPIINEKGEVIGFGGRILEDKAEHAKYKNTEQTKAFDKRRNLFAINIFKKVKRESNTPYAILVEGYMDVISLYEEGIYNSVASMGTALTPEQCRLLKRFTNTVMVCFDSDAAGQAATMRSLDLLSDAGLEVKVMSLPAKLDPDDTIKKYGKNGFLTLIDKALPLIDYKLKKIEESFDLSVLNNRSKYANACIDYLASLKDEIAANIYLEPVAEKSGTPIRTLADNLKARRENPSVRRPFAGAEREQRKSLKGIEQAEDIVLSALINKKEYAVPEDIEEIMFEDALKAAIASTIKAERQFKIGDLFNDGNEKEIGRLVSVILDVKDNYAEKIYSDALLKLKKAEWEKKIGKLNERYTASDSEEEKKDILREIHRLTLLLHQKEEKSQ